MMDFTIIIPTYNRPEHLKRLVGYYDSFGEPFQVIVADSSRDEKKLQNLEVISAVSNLDIRYLDEYTPETHPYRKYSDAAAHVESPYAVFCADDDFIVPNGIRASVAFLESNRDYVVAQGRYLSFKVIDRLMGSEKFRWNFAYKSISSESANPAARFELQFGAYTMPTIYGVHRSDILKKVYREMIASGIDLYVWGELLGTSLTVIFGKMKCLDDFYAARSEQTFGTGPGWPTTRDALKDGTYGEKYKPFRRCLVDHLRDQAGLNAEEAGRVVDKATDRYLGKFIAREIIGLPKSKKRALFDRLPLPESLSHSVLRTYFRLFRLTRIIHWRDTFIEKPAFLHSGSRDDLDRIARSVMSASETTVSEYTMPHV